jgi:hypothetical protein
MKSTIIAKDKQHLLKIIDEEIKLNGNDCDLNHIDISNLKELSYLFYMSSFNGEISKWNTSNILDMHGMFSNSEFNGEIRQWDVSNVELIYLMFENCSFNGDLSKWKPYNVKQFSDMFKNCKAPVPYWTAYEDKEFRRKAIDSYHLEKDLNNELDNDKAKAKKLKL